MRATKRRLPASGLPYALGAALMACGMPAWAASAVYTTEAAFVAAMARRMVEARDNGATYTEQVVARRCLNYISGAHGTPSLRQDIGRKNRNFTLSDTQTREFRACALEDGYRLR